LSELKKDLTDQIKRVEEPGYKPRNPILDAIGVISLETSAEPTQQAIAALAREVASLRSDVGDIKASLPEPPQVIGANTRLNPYVDQRGFSLVTGHFVGGC
jgi:capsule polysaccharide export protein KpsE/RkpR